MNYLETLNNKKFKKNPPVWFMRQAGRSSKSYRKLRKKNSFLKLIYNPKLIKEVTLQPINELDVDAAILFSDILTISEFYGQKLTLNDKKIELKPSLKNILKEEKNKEIIKKQKKNSNNLKNKIYDGIKKIKKEVKQKNKPLIGFCGGPLTVFLYMWEGRNAKNNDFKDATINLIKNKKTKKILNEITDLTIEHAINQYKSGIDAFQIFETWAGLIPYQFYLENILPLICKISKKISQFIPVTFFPRGIGLGYIHLLENYSNYFNCIGIDWQTPLNNLQKYNKKNIVLQGNLSPNLLSQDWKIIKKELENTYLPFGKKNKNWIFNLGHGVLPDTKQENLIKIIKWIRQQKWN